jgi:hypothetical protein
MFIIIIDIGNMLKNILENLGTHWEFFKNHVNTMGTFWECGGNISRTPKSKKIKLYIYILTPSSRILQN